MLRLAPFTQTIMPAPAFTRSALGLTTMAPSSPRWPLLILLVAVAAIFWPVLGFDFLWDDHLLVLQSRLTGSIGDLSAFFTTDLWASTPDPDPDAGYYRPLLLLDLALTRSIAGLDAGAHHLHGLVWHLVAVAGVFRLLRAIVRVPWAAATGTALFALHPVQVEAVAFVSARNDPMATALLVWSLLFLSRKAPCTKALAGGGILALAALLSKESVLLAPLLLPLVCRARRPDWGAPKSHGVLLGAVGTGLGLRALSGVGLPAQADIAHLLGALWPSLCHYLDRLLWPVDMAPMIHLGWPPPTPVLAGAVGIGLLIALGVVGRRRAGLGLGLASLGLAPALAGVAHTGIIVDRYLYLPMVGLALVVAAIAARLSLRHVGFAAVAGSLALLTGLHLPTWESDDTLWAASMARAPSGYAAGAYGRWLEDEGRLEAAAEAYMQAVQPPRPFETGCYNITRIYLALGRPAEAVRAGTAALHSGCAHSPELVAPMSVALAITGDWKAAEALAGSVGRDPTGKAVLVRLAARARAGDFEPLRAELVTAGPAGSRLIGLVSDLIAFSGEPGRAAAVRAAVAD